MNAYHNLAGWLRDVRSVLGDRTELADSYYWQLRDLLEEVLELVGDDEPATDELEPEDADADMVSAGPRDSGNAGSQRPRPRASRSAALGGSARVADLLPRHSRLETRAAAGDPTAVAGTGLGVRRTATVEVPLAEANVPRETSGRVRKRTATVTRTRGKSQTSTRKRGKVRR